LILINKGLIVNQTIPKTKMAQSSIHTFIASLEANLSTIFPAAMQLAAIRTVKPGHHWNQPHDATVKVVTAGLRDLGLLDGEVNELIETEAYRPFYMHRAGHWLGMDVHDVGDYKLGDEWRVLEPGMVLTVEPGIYVAPDNHTVAKKWRGIGIRIEDDVAVTRKGHQVLSAEAPKLPDDIEKLMRQRA
jgi:Xaa-Pro aminopeptidase